MDFAASMKACCRCHELKPPEQFVRSGNKIKTTCRDCAAKRVRKYYREHPDKYQEQQEKKRGSHQYAKYKEQYIAYKKAHPAERKKWQHDYYVRSKDKALAAIRKWRVENPEAERLTRKKWIETHKQQALGYTHKRHAQIRKAGSFTQEEWDELCDRYGRACLACGKIMPLTIDHVIPLSKGGKNTIDNLQPLCLKCNDSKGTRTMDYRNGVLRPNS